MGQTLNGMDQDGLLPLTQVGLHQATNGSEAGQDAKNQSLNSNPKRGLPRSNLDTSGSSVQSDRSDISEQSESDPKIEPPEDSFLKLARFRSRKPGKKAMVPRKGETIIARKKGTDLWYGYKFLGKGTKNTKGLQNLWLNAQTEDGKEIKFRENDSDWLMKPVT